jgi:uncharacterized membrane protein YgcG
MRFLLVLIIVAAIGYAVYYYSRQKSTALADAQADARRVIELLGGQVFNLAPTDDAARQALADASERYTAASSQIAQADTAHKAQLAKQSAVEGLHYVRAARSAMGIDPGPPLEALAGQQAAGSVTENRQIQFDGRQVQASPQPSPNTPNYYPGGRVAGRPVPAGWYSEPWWKPALRAGAWGVGSALLFDSLFHGMHGVNYGAQGFESGFGSGYDQGYQQGFDQNQFGDSGQAQDVSWNDNPNWDNGNSDSGWGFGGGGDSGWDFGGGDFGGGGDF